MGGAWGVPHASPITHGSRDTPNGGGLVAIWGGAWLKPRPFWGIGGAVCGHARLWEGSGESHTRFRRRGFALTTHPPLGEQCAQSHVHKMGPPNSGRGLLWPRPLLNRGAWPLEATPPVAEPRALQTTSCCCCARRSSGGCSRPSAPRSGCGRPARTRTGWTWGGTPTTPRPTSSTAGGCRGDGTPPRMGSPRVGMGPSSTGMGNSSLGLGWDGTPATRMVPPHLGWEHPEAVGGPSGKIKLSRACLIMHVFWDPRRLGQGTLYPKTGLRWALGYPGALGPPNMIGTCWFGWG